MLRNLFREWYFRPIRLIGILFFFLSPTFPGTVFSQETQVLPPDVRLVIDVSGSMKRNDPNNLRQPAVELLVQLLPDNSKAGIWTFGKWVNMLVPHKDVNLQWRESTQEKSTSINSVGLFTNIGEALEKAAYDSANQAKTHRKSIILLTDGMVDIDKDPEVNRREWRRIVDEVLPKLKAAGFTIHTVALSDNADRNLLGKLSLSTDGLAEVAHTADDLMKIFLKAFDVAAPSEQVPLKDNRFVVDSSIEEFTALIFRQNPKETTELVGPDESVVRAGQESEGVNWHATGNYDLITVKRPLEGEWLIKADMAPESRITIVSNLNLRVKPLPNNVYKGQGLDAQFALIEDGKVIKRREFLSLMEVDIGMSAGVDETDLRAVWSENLSRKEPPANGTYRSILPEFDRNGIYELNIVVDGKTFQRTFKHRLTVRQPFAAEINEEFKEGKLDYVLTIKSFDTEVEILKTEVVASVTTPAGSKKFIPLALTEMDTWRGNFAPEAEGQYIAEVRIKGQTKKGEAFDILLEDLRINYSMEEGLVATPPAFFPEPEVESEPEPEVEVGDQTETTESVVPVVKQEPLPPWMLYSMLGLGNLILMTFGFILYKKLTRSESDDDVLAEFSDENIAANPQTQRANETSPEEGVSEPEPSTASDDDNMEEPPMEDLEPAMEDLSELTGGDEPPMEEIDLSSPEETLEDVTENTDLDDLDQMAVEAADAAEEPDEDDDMVNAMLKAQGLDLAGEELDDAISSLIDDMEADSDEEK